MCGITRRPAGGARAHSSCIETIQTADPPPPGSGVGIRERAARRPDLCSTSIQAALMALGSAWGEGERKSGGRNESVQAIENRATRAG